MELIKGRPADETGRLEKEIRVYDLLDKLGMEYYRTDHEPATTMEVCNDIDKILDTLICKNLFLCNRQKTNFYMLMMPGDKPFKTKDLSKQINSARLSFADESYMELVKRYNRLENSSGEIYYFDDSEMLSYDKFMQHVLERKGDIAEIEWLKLSEVTVL